MSKNVRIRDLAREDWAAWRQLWTAYLAFYKTSRPDEVFESTFERLLSDKGGEFQCLLAEVDGQVLGLTHFLHHRHCWSVEDTTYLQDLYVDPAARGTGLGRALIEAVYDRADAAGAPSVYWLTKEDNHTARQLYDRIAQVQDFVRYGRT